MNTLAIAEAVLCAGSGTYLYRQSQLSQTSSSIATVRTSTYEGNISVGDRHFLYEIFSKDFSSLPIDVGGWGAFHLSEYFFGCPLSNAWWRSSPRYGSKSKRSIHDESMTSELHSSLLILHKINNNNIVYLRSRLLPCLKPIVPKPRRLCLR